MTNKNVNILMVIGKLEISGCTSWRPPEHAKDRGVSLVLSD